MSRELRDDAEYERAKKAVRQLEGAAKAMKCECHRATAKTKEEADVPGTCRRCLLWARAMNGAHAVLAYEWGSNEGDVPVPVIRPLRDPRARQFVDWWELNYADFESPYMVDGFHHWVRPRELEFDDFFDLFDAVMDEYDERECEDPARFGHWVKEPEGMVITDFENIPDAEEAA